MAVTLQTPSVSVPAPQRIIAEPLGGSREVFYYLSSFPDTIYQKTPDTLLYALMRALLGDAGVNLLARQLYQARATTEEMNLDIGQLDAFFANPFGFSRNSKEQYSPPSGPVPLHEEQLIRAADASFFARAVNYISGAKAGNTPLGIQKVAEAGLGYGAAVVENYQYLYDQHSDRPLNLPYFGQTTSTEEFIILPNPEVSLTPTIEVSFEGIITGGSITFGFGRSNQPSTVTQNSTWTTTSPTVSVAASVDASTMAAALAGLAGIGANNVIVGGEPGGPYYISFQNAIDIDSIQMLNIYNDLTGTSVSIFINPLYGQIDANQEVINVTSEDAFVLHEALNHTRPVASLFTIFPSRGGFQKIGYGDNVGSTSEYSEVIRFVTGVSSITWPSGEPQFWIQSQVENQAPRLFKDVYYNYQGWHNIQSITSSTMGTTAIQPADQSASNPQIINIYTPDMAVANYAEPLFITTIDDSTDLLNGYLNHIYPITYETIPGAPPVIYAQKYWLSQPGTGTEWLVIDLQSPQAANYISFDIVQNPLQVDILYDTFDDPIQSKFVPVTPIIPYHNTLTATIQLQNTSSVGLTFSNSLQQMIFTRRFKILFTRLQGYSGTIQVANLRIGRNVAS